jgi:branched-chain amino acid aminotransferase
MKIYINGEFYDKADARISVYDHGLLYGDGVFEGIRVYNGKVFRLREHVIRLFESAKSINLEIPMTRLEMAEAIRETVRVNEMINGYLRPLVTRGVGNLGLDPRTCVRPNIIIIADQISLYPAKYYDEGLSIITVGTVRNHHNAVNPRVKSLNYLNNVMARMEAGLADCQEALMLNVNGEVAECSGDNIFLVKNHTLRTPPISAGILDGVTRQTIIDLARSAHVEVVECTLTRHDVYVSDEVFLTGTAAEIVPVVRCDGRVIGNGKPGNLTRMLRERFVALTREEEDYLGLKDEPIYPDHGLELMAR